MRYCDQDNKNYVDFWEQEAEKIDWFKKWTVTEEKGFPFVRWFKDGKLNASYNCLDKHVNAGLGNKIAFYWENERGDSRRLTYKDLLDETSKLANVYKKLGIRKGDKISIYMPMVPESIIAMLAATRIGAAHNFIFGGIGCKSVEGRINDSESVLLVTADGGFRRGEIINYKKIADQALTNCPTVKHTLVLKHTKQQINMIRNRDVWYHEAMECAENVCQCVSMDSEDMMFLLYTSGTTGKPKGIIHTTAGYLVGVNSTYQLVFDIKPSDVYWCTADPGWITGHSFVVYGPMCNGVTQFMYEGAFDYPSKDQFAKFIEKYKVSTFYTAPTLISMMMKWGEKSCINSHNLSSLRLLGSIGEPLKPEVWGWYNKYIGNNKCPIVDTWFQTETGAFVISPIPFSTKLRPGSVGRPLPGYTVDVLDELGKSVERGLLAIKKPFPSMMRGIYKNNDRYLKNYWQKWHGKYYYAGDKASIDKDGYFYVSGRADEIIKVAGHRIGTAEVEASILCESRVAEAAVAGVEDEIKGTIIVAFVVLKENILYRNDIKNKITEIVKRDLGSYAKPSHIIFVSQIPKNRSGKVLRRILKCIFEGKDYGNIETLVNPEAVEEAKLEVRKYRKEIYNDPFLYCKYFSEITSSVKFSVSEIVSAIQPILSKHLSNNIYNRLYPVVQFLDFFDKERKNCGTCSPLYALKKFDIDSIVFSGNHNGPCFTLINNFYNDIPSKFNPFFVSAKMSRNFQQEGWHKYSHVAVVIHYQDPQKNEENGIILLDPNFDIPVPIVFKNKNDMVTIDMGNKRGKWHFSYDGIMVTCQSDNERLASKTGSVDQMEIYVRRSVINPHLFALKPMIANDKSMSVVSRDERGTHLAHLKLNMEKQTITRSIGECYLPIKTFNEFLEDPFEKFYCDKLNLPKDELNLAVKKVITHSDVLSQLREDFSKEWVL